MRLGDLRACALVLMVPAVGQAQTLAIDWHSFTGNGGGRSVGGGIEVSGTVGEANAGSMGFGGFRIEGGFQTVSLPRASRGTITRFDATAGPSRIRLSWESPSSGKGVTSFVLSRKNLSAGGQLFVAIREIPYTAPGEYEFLDQTAVAGTRYAYLLSERYQAGPAIPRARVAASSFGTTLPANVVRVGRNGRFANIASAIAAATGPDWVITVQPGTYPSFSVGANAPTNLRIIADGTGAVHIDTTGGPLSIQGRRAGQVVELRGLTVGDPKSREAALRIRDSRGLVIVDSSILQGGVNRPAVHLDDATHVALQRCATSGAPGLLAVDGSEAIAGRGSINSLTLTGKSEVTLCQLDPANRSVETGSTVTDLSGVMPDLRANAFHAWTSPLDMEIETFANGVVQFMMAGANDWLTGPGFELPVLLSVPSLVLTVSAVADAQGSLQLSFAVPRSVDLLGRPLPTQFASLDPANLTLRLSNAHTFVILR